ncbi:DUF1385 domain-containing protein [Candidatus Sumerlaeota bacterium]|nr:DUF1385 domain-containing protein [Candidatus Sumerlaeota bacterium]
MSESTEKPRFDVGGQAVIEGVMMRGPRGYVTAVRVPSTGEIVTQEVPYRPIAKRWRPAKWPVLRGAVGMIEMMVIGLKTLNHSANIVAEDEEEKDRREKIANGEDPGEKKEASSLSRLALTLTLIVSMVFAMGLFIAIPNLLTHGLSNWGQVRELAAAEGWGHALWELARGGGMEFQEYESPILYNILAGCVRVTIFLLYIWAISLINDIRRVFQYHGAEHMSIKTYEAGEPLEVKYARTKSREHPRCGTTFIFVTMILAILIFSVMTKILVHLWPWLTTINWWGFKGIIIVTHVAMMPLVAGLGYEIIKFAGRCPKHPLIRPVIWPGLMFQRLTTRPPDDEMLEVALCSLQRALALAEVPVEDGSLDEASGAIY